MEILGYQFESSREDMCMNDFQLPTPTTQRHLLTETQLAQRWQVTTKKLQADRYNGKGCEFIRIGRLVRYSPTAIELFETNNSFNSTTEASNV